MMLCKITLTWWLCNLRFFHIILIKYCIPVILRKKFDLSNMLLCRQNWILNLLYIFYLWVEPFTITMVLIFCRQNYIFWWKMTKSIVSITLFNYLPTKINQGFIKCFLSLGDTLLGVLLLMIFFILNLCWIDWCGRKVRVLNVYIALHTSSWNIIT